MIPTCFLQSDDYQSLTPEQVARLEQRLTAYAEVANKVREFAESRVVGSGSRLGEVELDIYASIALSMEQADALSPWLLHAASPATGDLQPRQSAAHGFAALLERGLPTPNSSADDFVNWYRKWVLTFDRVLLSFKEAATLDIATAQCIAIDALMAMLLTAGSVARLNPAMAA